MVATTTPRETFASRARAGFTIPGPTRPDDVALDPVGLSPSFPQPMVEPLTDVAQRLVLPGLDLVPPNTVVPLETNNAFVEAYLVGLNTEMGRELLWRGYPGRPARDVLQPLLGRLVLAGPAARHGRPVRVGRPRAGGGHGRGGLRAAGAQRAAAPLPRRDRLRHQAGRGEAPDLQRWLRPGRALLRLRHRRGHHRRLEHRHPGAPLGAAVRHRGRRRHRHHHPRRAGRRRCRAHRAGRASDAGADHHPGHGPDEAE